MIYFNIDRSSLQRQTNMGKPAPKTEKEHQEAVERGSEFSSLALGGYEPDCGFNGERYLSWEKAELVLSGREIGMLNTVIEDDGKVDNIITKYPLSAPFGMHTFSKSNPIIWFLRKIRLWRDPRESILEKYGVGLVLYFKFLKVS